ncbi:MAG: hypothetical protein AUI09_01850 [Gemmatimonadetes bacterium 13_2_20CM_2_66_5]|nr:MAG: hypothetical protein AUI09_01850 [Gemmatimonadetes bacterium 13_2_20CM_2_66_5]
MRLAAREIEPRRSVDRHDGRAVLGHALREGKHVPLRGTHSPGPEQGIDGNRGLRPRFLATQLAHAVETRERAIVDRVVRLGIDRGDPDRNAGRVQRAREHPAIAAVVARARGDQHPTGQRVRKLGDEHLRDGATGGLHQHPAGHAILRARGRIPGRHLARRQNRNRIHGITTPAYPTTRALSPETQPEWR